MDVYVTEAARVWPPRLAPSLSKDRQRGLSQEDQSPESAPGSAKRESYREKSEREYEAMEIPFTILDILC